MARIDYLGIAVFVAATTLLLYGLTTGGTAEPWKSASVLAPLIIGFAGLAVFIIIEWKAAKDPMVPIRIFSNRSANTGFFGAFIHGLVLWAFAYYLIIFVSLAPKKMCGVCFLLIICSFWVLARICFSSLPPKHFPGAHLSRSLLSFVGSGSRKLYDSKK